MLSLRFKAHENVGEGRRSINTVRDREGGDIGGKKRERRERRRKRENMNEMSAGKNSSRRWALCCALVDGKTSTGWRELDRGSNLRKKSGQQHSGFAQQSGLCGVWEEPMLGGW